ncbi:MAG: M48 family metalloprotease [Acidobacteria bacterium]|nr:M48 family metalloprotease [Acidobacteriota bacterium]
MTCVLAFGLSCTTAFAVSIVSVRDEIEIGRQAQAQVRAQVPEVNDSLVRGYVASIGRRLVASAGGPRYPYSFSIADYKEINAFALPGGPVWVHRGAIDISQNEAQLAGVLAHEIAHVAQRHAAEQLTKATIANGVLGFLDAVLGGGGGARTARVAAGLFANGLFLKYSRDDESEADRVGAEIMRRAGWDPQGLVAFLQILRAQQGRDPSSVEVFLSSHPSPAGRVERLQSVIGSARGRRDSDRFQEVQRRLDQLPPPHRMPRG